MSARPILVKQRLSRRQFLRAALTAGAGVVLAGCSAGETDRYAVPAQAERVDLVVMARAEEFAAEALRQFGIASLSVLRPERSRLFEMAAAGEALDVACLKAGEVPWLAQQALLQGIDFFLSASQQIEPNDLFEVNDQLTYAGERFGLMAEWSPDYFVWVNRRLWQQAGLDLPDPAQAPTLSDWRGLSKRLTSGADGQVEIFGTDFEIGWQELAWLAATVSPDLQVFSQDGRRLALASQADFVALVRWIEEWKLEGGLPVKLATAAVAGNLISCDCLADENASLPPTLVSFVSGSSAELDWLQGQAVATLQGLGLGSKIAGSQVSDDEVLVLPAPAYGPLDANPSHKGLAYTLPAMARHPQAAWRFIEWQCAGEPAGERARKGVGLAALRSHLSALPGSLGWQKQLAGRVEAVVDHGAVTRQPFSPYIDPELLQTVWSELEEAYWRGRDNLENLLTSFENRINRIA